MQLGKKRSFLNKLDKKQHTLCFTAEQDNSTISMSKTGTVHSLNLEYSTDNEQTWSTFIPGSTTITLAKKGNKVCLRATAAGNSSTGAAYDRYWNFSMSGKIAATGNITTLLNQNGLTELTAEYTFNFLFKNCSSLTKAPELPATTLASQCYSNIFLGCSSIIKPPALPAKNLARHCYWCMFRGCTSLTQAPELPATIVPASCYRYMFDNCISLTKAPELLATTLTSECYSYMFNGCSNLTSVNINFTQWTPTNATENWLQNVSSTGNFYCPTSLPDTKGVSYIPTNWTRVNK